MEKLSPTLVSESHYYVYKIIRDNQISHFVPVVCGNQCMDTKKTSCLTFAHFSHCLIGDFLILTFICQEMHAHYYGRKENWPWPAVVERKERHSGSTVLVVIEMPMQII